MRNNFVHFLASTAILAALALSPAMAQTSPNGMQGGKAPASKMNHPAIQNAVRHLKVAKDTLTQDTGNDYEGHKDKALKAIDEALEELHQAMQVKK